MSRVHVGMPVSYDYEFIRTSIPLVYAAADTITIALDKDRFTWGGTRFEVAPQFLDWLKEFDSDHKIRVYEDTFYIPGLTPLEMDTQERRKLADAMPSGGWYVQIDADEYFLDFEDFAKKLSKTPIDQAPVEIRAKSIPVIKNCEGGFFVVKTREPFSLATNAPLYKAARVCGHSKSIWTNTPIVHQSWARTDEEVRGKLKSWGHASDFDTDGFYRLWAAIDSYNFRFLRDFHPLSPALWPALEFISAPDIGGLLAVLRGLPREWPNNTGDIDWRPISVRDFVPPIASRILKKVRRWIGDRS